MFAHEQLQVYRKALDFAAKAAAWTSVWPKKNSFVDHLARASENIVLNLAEAARQRDAPARLRIADFSIGSSLECAGCLDLARVNELLTDQQCRQEKQMLCDATKMLFGLRKAWSQSVVREEPVLYTSASSTELLFHHEGLEVYRTSLSFMEWLVSVPEGKELSNRVFRNLDEAGLASSSTSPKAMAGTPNWTSITS